MKALLTLALASCVRGVPPPPDPAPEAAPEPASTSAPTLEAGLRRGAELPSTPEEVAVMGRLVRQPLPTELGGGVALALRLEDGALVLLDAQPRDPAWSALEGRRVRVRGLLRPGWGEGLAGAAFLSRPGPAEALDLPPAPQGVHLAAGPVDGALALLAEVQGRPVLSFGAGHVPDMVLTSASPPEAGLGALAEAAGLAWGQTSGMWWVAPGTVALPEEALDVEGRLWWPHGRVEARALAAGLAAEAGLELTAPPTGWLLAGGELPVGPSLSLLAAVAERSAARRGTGISLGGGALPPSFGPGCEGPDCCAPLDAHGVAGVSPGARPRALVQAEGPGPAVLGPGDPLGCPVLRPEDALPERWIVDEIDASGLWLRFPSTGRRHRLALGG